jgi:MYXO-CTERM domain-containing protein
MSPASAAVIYEVTITNNTLLEVNDVRLLFTGTGGTIRDRLVLQPGGGVILASAGNEFNASFNPLAPGANFVGRFTADHPGVQFNSGNWTIDNNPAGNIEVRTVKLTAVPGPAAVAPFALGLIAALRRRKSA